MHEILSKSKLARLRERGENLNPQGASQKQDGVGVNANSILFFRRIMRLGMSHVDG